MKKMIFGCMLFFGGLLGLLLFPITARHGPWVVSRDVVSVSMFTFSFLLISGFVICFYETYVRE